MSVQRSVRLVLAAVVAAVLAASAVSAPQAAAAPSAPKLSWSPCFQKIGSYECATLQVPLDYGRPNGAAISVAVVRLPATDPAHRIGSLVLNPGGPGGSGVDYAVFAGPDLYTPEVRARFDLVGFDPRGIARSTALRCFGSQRQWDPYFLPIAFPVTPADEELWAGADRFLTDACDQRGGAIADHMSTADVARDMDRLRAALGDDQLTYAGVSYGSFLGTTYANMFPDRVRAVVVDGVLDPIAWTTGRGSESSTLPFSARLHSDVGAQATLDELFRLCDAAGPGRCALAPGAAQRYAALADRLRTTPVPLVDPETGETFDYTYSLLVGDTLSALYDSASWPDFVAFVASVESQSAAAVAGARLRTLRTSTGFIAKRNFPRYPNFLEGFAPVACADSDNPSSYAAWSAAGAAEDAATGYFGRIWTWVSSICAVWPGPSSDRYAGPFNRTTAHPVLVVGNQFDPATPYHGAVTVANLLPGSRLLTVHGWGHTSLFLSACADDAIGHYLVTTQPPPAGTVCEQDVVPFTAAAAAAARSRAAARAEVLAPYRVAVGT